MLFANQKDEYKWALRYTKELNPGQREQCERFLTYYKDGIGMCERYLAIESGEVIVKTANKPAFWRLVKNLLTVEPGLTSAQLVERMKCHRTSINNCLGKGLKSGKFKRKGERFYAA